jgi:hypothetical protein
MIGKKINQLATELAPVSTDLTIIGDPDSGVSKKITLAQLGAIFSGAVSFYTDLASFPATGDINVIYCAKDTQKLYLWSGSAYVEVFPSQALLDTYQLRSEKGNANGYASLDSGGKVPISQLPSSIMEYKGTWNASTNTPTLANGTGDTGDVYICNVAGTVNFGAGAITFAVGDYVIYSGTIWQRSSGAVGTVTSVALTVGGDAISVSGSPLTTSGTLALAFIGTTSQYIRGNGTLANFPTSLVSGSGTANRLTKWSSTSGEIVNSNILDTGTTITNLNATADFFSCQFNGNPTTGRSYGVLIAAGSNASDISFRIEDVSSSSVYFYVWGDGKVQINNIPNATTDTDRFLVSDSGVIKYRTGAELLSDIGGASASGYVPYTGATANLDLGTHTLIAAKGTFSSSGSGDTVGITHSSGSGIALNITKGGNGEGLYINKTSGSGNAATIIGTLNATTLVKSGGTSSQFLKADGSVDSTSYGTGSVTSVGLSSATSGVTIGSTPITTSGTITLAIATASGSQQGLLSSTDWTTFNNKQNALTNPVTGTGTTNYLPKFTGASTIGNSQVFDNGTNVGIGTASPTTALHVLANSGLDEGNAAAIIRQAGSNNNNGLLVDVTNSVNAYIADFRQANSSLVRITGAGNVGIGLTSVNEKLMVNGAIVTNSFLNNNQTSSSVFDFYLGTARIFSYGASGVNGNIGFYTASAGSSASETMRITGAGELCVGRTTAYGAGFLVNVEGNIYASAAIVAGSSVTVNGNIVYINGGQPETRYAENDVGALPLGLWRTVLGGDAFYVQKNTAVAGDFSTAINCLQFTSTGAATFSSSGLFSGNLQTNSVLTIGNQFVAGNYCLQITPSTTTPIALQGILAGVGISDIVMQPSGGNVGIGTTNIGGKFHVKIDTDLNIAFNSTGGVARISSFNDAISLNQPLIINGEDLRFNAGGSERMRITSDGALLVGASSAPSSTQSGVAIQNPRLLGPTIFSSGNVSDNRTFIQFVNSNGVVGSISTSGTLTSYNVTSDYRLKQDYKDYSGLDLVNKIKTYDYEWKADKSRGYGVIAHELQSVINYAVTGVKDGKEMQGVDYSKIVPVLIKSIQELKQELDTLKNK